ncbi:hypothetical protein [Melioribacter sp. OK-6-Me]|uniref:hypothetical protein n=1 Tax=unclassified Melioribacter TaxID=2627329 RepID=UPI003ED92A2E
MKRILFLLIVSYTLLSAQENAEIGWVARFGLAGGINPVYLFPNVEPLNSQIQSIGLSGLSENGMIAWGGSGYAYIMFVENLRIGGVGLSGSMNTSGKVGEFDKEVRYGYGLGGLTIEYTFPSVHRIAISVGGIIGMTSTEIEIYQSSMNYNWENLWQKGNNKTQEVSDKLSKTSYLIAPTINFDIPINRFIAFRVGAGYSFNFGGEWEINNGKNIEGVPSDLNSNTFFIQTGIYFGFFSY